MSDQPHSTGPSLPLGIFARVFARRTADELAEAIAEAGYRQVQLNLSSLGHPTVPDESTLRDIDFAAIDAAFEAHGVSIWGLSATVNLIHPDPDRRARELSNAVNLVGRAPDVRATAVTLCTGTRDPDNPWRAHPANDEASAWSDLRASLDLLIPAALEAGVRLGIEPEAGNVVCDAHRARRLLDELGSDGGPVGIVLDAANLVGGDLLQRQAAVLSDAFEILGDRIICLHAKEVDDGVAPGDGSVDYDHVLCLWSALPNRVPIIVQDVSEPQARSTADRLSELAHASAPDRPGP